MGTQLVAKGFDFHNITLVGVLLADIGMNMPDFRSSERIFALLMQVAGRSGRGDAPGKVIIQTLDDENPLFRFIKNMIITGFTAPSWRCGGCCMYPPFSRMARLLVRGRAEERVIASINALKTALDAAIREQGCVSARNGPVIGAIREDRGKLPPPYHTQVRKTRAASRGDRRLPGRRNRP